MNYNQVEFKERRSNEGDITLVRKSEKRSSSGHGAESRRNVHLHIVVVRMLWETLVNHRVTQMLCQNYSRQNLFQDSLALTTLAFRAVCVEFTVGQIRARDRDYLSIRFIFRTSEATVIVFRGWRRTGLTSVQFKTPLEVLFSRTELSALTVVNSLYKCSNNVFALSEIMENGLLCGGVRRK